MSIYKIFTDENGKKKIKSIDGTLVEVRTIRDYTRKDRLIYEEELAAMKPKKSQMIVDEGDEGDDKDKIIADLKTRIAELESQLKALNENE